MWIMDDGRPALDYGEIVPGWQLIVTATNRRMVPLAGTDGESADIEWPASPEYAYAYSNEQRAAVGAILKALGRVPPLAQY